MAGEETQSLEPLATEPQEAAQSVQGPTPHELAMMIAGDDDRAKQILRIVEGSEDFKIVHDSLTHDSALALPTLSLEAFGSDSASLLSRIIEWLKKLIDTVFDEMTAHQGAVMYVERAAADLKVMSRDRRTHSVSSGTFKVDTRVQNLCVRYRPIEQANGLVMALRNMDKLLRAYYGYQPLQAAPQILSAANGADEAGVVQQMQSASPMKLQTSGAVFSHPEVDNWLASAPLMGNVRLVLKKRESGSDVDRIRGMMLRLLPEEVTPRPMPTSIDFVRFSLSNSDQLLSQIQDTARFMANINQASVRAQRKRQLETVVGFLTNLQREAGRSSEPASVDRIATIAGLVEQYVDWIVNPYNSLYGLACRNLRAALRVCELNAQ